VRALPAGSTARGYLMELHMDESFTAVLGSYAKTPGLTSANRAHLKRWVEDNRAEEGWQIIKRAVLECGRLLPANTFIEEILATRTVSEVMASRAKYRREYRAHAKRMEETAAFLRKPHPMGMPPTFPRSAELAQLLDDAAAAYRSAVEPTRYVPGVVNASRESNAATVFMSQVGHYLKGITGQWLGDQVTVLTEIAFKDIGDVDVEQVERARRNVRRRPATVKPPA
jgi:hypothetical protein